MKGRAAIETARAAVDLYADTPNAHMVGVGGGGEEVESEAEEEDDTAQLVCIVTEAVTK
jgi:hypothetical protein